MNIEDNRYPNIFHTPMISNHYTVWFTNDIENVSFYDHVLHLLYISEESDVIDLMISSYGGSLDSLLALRAAIGASKAVVNGHLLANASSAAGMLLLSCHNFIINEFSTFHAHTCSYGSFGKSDDVRSQVEFVTKQTESIVRSVYKNILDDCEIQKLLDGKEFYFTHDEIQERLQKREEMKIELAKSQLDKEMDDLSEFTTEDLEEEVKALQAELRERKKKQKQPVDKTI